MSEKLLKFLLSELKRARIVCRKCGAIVEMSLDQLRNTEELNCPGCPKDKTAFRPRIHPDAFADLAYAIQKLKEMKDVEVEFILPDKAEPVCAK